MRLKQQLLYVAGAIVLAGGLCAQQPGGGQYPPQNPQGSPGMGNPTYPNSPNNPNYPNGPGMGPSESQTQPADSTASDKKFVKEAAEGGAAEIELGKLAEEKGSSEAVKQFGERMATDHEKANERLKKAAAHANINVPDAMPARDRKLKDKLSKLTGPAFDREYMRAMVSDHKSDLKAFERESQSGQIPQIKEFASNTLPTLQDHLKSAEQIAGEETNKTTNKMSSNAR